MHAQTLIHYVLWLFVESVLMEKLACLLRRMVAHTLGLPDTCILFVSDSIGVRFSIGRFIFSKPFPNVSHIFGIEILQ